MRLARRLLRALALARVTVAFFLVADLARVTVALRVLARLVIDALRTVALRVFARDDTRAFLTGARYAGTENAASESATSFAIFDTYPRVSRNGGTPR